MNPENFLKCFSFDLQLLTHIINFHCKKTLWQHQICRKKTFVSITASQVTDSIHFCALRLNNCHDGFSWRVKTREKKLLMIQGLHFLFPVCTYTLDHRSTEDVASRFLGLWNSFARIKLCKKLKRFIEKLKKSFLRGKKTNSQKSSWWRKTTDWLWVQPIN